LELVGELNRDLALAFLRHWPEVITLKTAKPAVLRRFYYVHHLRRPQRRQQHLQFIAQAVALTTDPARVRVAVFHLHALLDPLQTLRRHVARLDAQIKPAFAAHAEAYLFRHLPGAGPALAPRLGVAFGTLRSQFPDPASLQKLAGLAPVREKSGQSVWIHWRWQAPVFLRQTLVEWAGQTVVYSPWARRYYQRRQARGKGRGVILRALAFKWGAHPLEMLANPHPLRRGPLPPPIGAPPKPQCPARLTGPPFLKKTLRGPPQVLPHKLGRCLRSARLRQPEGIR
jgi:hypothetical protein